MKYNAHSHLDNVKHSIFLRSKIKIKAIRSACLLGIVIVANIIFVGCASWEDEGFGFGQEAYKLVETQIEFGDRIPGSDAHERTSAWIETELESHGWIVSTQEFEYMSVPLKNIIGKSDSRIVPNPILIGAHYDTRPLADRDTTHPDRPVPGANDGASGVAVLLMLAKELEIDNLSQPVWLVFFDAEDSGDIAGWDWIVGSSYFAEHLDNTIEAVVIVDMVGDKELGLYFENTSDQYLAHAIWEVAAEHGFSSFIPDQGYSIIDDHTPFLRMGIPAVDVIDFDYPFWHTTDDTLNKISALSLEQVGKTLLFWIESYAAIE